MKHQEVIRNKIMDLPALLVKLRTWRLKNEKVVFTNGCFDIIHPGHAEYLAKARDHGRRLVIGLNTDASLKTLDKGDERPIQHEEARAEVLASMHVVDAVVLFNDETPYELIKAIQPEVLAKGGDYDPDVTDPSDSKYIVGSELVKENGGEVITIPFKEGYSTSSIVEKIRSSK